MQTIAIHFQLGTSFQQYADYKIVQLIDSNQGTSKKNFRIVDRKFYPLCSHRYENEKILLDWLENKWTFEDPLCQICANNDDNDLQKTHPSIFNFLQDLEQNKHIIELGRGGAGIVYRHEPNLKSVFKVSKVKTACRQWGKEFGILQLAQETLIQTVPDFEKKFETVTINFPLDYVSQEKNDRCVIELPGIFHPEKENFMIHPQFGVDDLDYHQKTRGHFLGIKQLKNKYLPDKLIEKYVFELGKVLSYLHFGAKNDGYDLEILLGTTYEDPTLKLFIVDFDLTENIDEYSKKTIKRMVWALDAVPYFPESDNALFIPFKKGYLEIANDLGLLEIAEKVLNEYSED